MWLRLVEKMSGSFQELDICIFMPPFHVVLPGSRRELALFIATSGTCNKAMHYISD